MLCLLLRRAVRERVARPVQQSSPPHHLADEVTIEDVEDDVEMEAGTSVRSLQFCDIPAPYLVRHR